MIGLDVSANHHNMKITFKLFAGLSTYLPSAATRNSTEIDVQPGETVHQVIDRFNVPREEALLVMVNGIYISPEQRDLSEIRAGDTLAIWPPVAGG